MALSGLGEGLNSGRLGTNPAKWSERDSNLGDPDFLFDALTTRPSSAGSTSVQLSGEECSLFTISFSISEHKNGKCNI